jgi:magnesium chelatase subunit D
VDTTGAFRMDRQRRLLVQAAAGRREDPAISRKRGKYARSRFPQGQGGDVALDATLRAAAGRSANAGKRSLQILTEDLREKVRRHRSPYVIAFVVDNSWSMHVETTMERTKGVVLELLRNARIFHDKVALVAFRHNRTPDATVCLPLTNSYTLASRRLGEIPLSGTTPLPDGIWKALALLRQERIKYHNAIPVMVIVTDGLPNVPLKRGGDAYRDVTMLCNRLRWEGIDTIVVDTEPTGKAAGRSNCREMAVLSRGKYLSLSSLTRQGIEKALGN